MSKDLSLFFAIINCLILCATVFYIYRSPIKAVKIGRLLNDEQRFDFTKRNLFLTLYSYRGSATHTHFVEALNQIDVVFHGVPSVLQSWHKYYESLNSLGEKEEETEKHRENWTLLRVELLSQMATHLGYGSLKQIDMMKYYFSKGQGWREQSDMDLKMSAITYLKSGAAAFELLIENTPKKEPDTIENKP